MFQGFTTAYIWKTLNPSNGCGIAGICKLIPPSLYGDLVLYIFMFLIEVKLTIEGISSLFKATPIMNAANGKISSGAIEADSAVFDPQLIQDFLLDMSFDCNTLPSPRNRILEAMAVIKVADLGLSNHDLQPIASIHSLSCHFAESCLPNQPLELKVYVAVYTWLLVLVDDIFLNSPEIQTFSLKFGTGEPQGHPLLDCIARLLKYETPKFFGSCVTNLIISSTLHGINGHIIESKFLHGFPHSMSGFAAWIRAKTGYGDAYGYFIFSEREFPESEWLGCYIQGVPNLGNVISYTNDILSFYKERVRRREANTLISNLAEENGCDVVASLKDLCAHTVVMTHDIRQGYAREGGALLEAFDSYIFGYIKWHLEMTDRYHLGEIGLSLKPALWQSCRLVEDHRARV